MNPLHSNHHAKSHRTHPPVALGKGRLQTRRRSSRILLSASVALSGEDRLKCSFSMPAKASNLNKHGAIVQLSRDLVVGSVVMVKNQQGAQLSARVVTQLTATQGLSSYGIEFVEHEEQVRAFWGISFPPNA